MSICLNCGNPCKKSALLYCSHSCNEEYERKRKIGLWKSGDWDGMYPNGKELSKIIRSYLILVAGNKCQLCGWGIENCFTKKVPLHIHHIDGRYNNNLESNLQVLCPNCHSLTKTFGAKNKGNGRTFRYNK